MEIDNQVPPVKINWLWPGFEDILSQINEHLDLRVERSNKILMGESPTCYKLKDGFLEQDSYWMDQVNTNRIRSDLTVLYRPGIVNELVQQVEHMLESDEMEGIIIKGPEGVGKSYTLVNLTRYLLASQKYVVTIIPDCNNWDTMGYFLRHLLSSVGVDVLDLGLTYESIDNDDLHGLIRDIDKVLQERRMKWVFIFDQINRIFARDEFSTAKDVGTLPYPFKIMTNVRMEGRIISIISASTNNDKSHREKYPGFERSFDHPIQFEKHELEVLYTEEKVASWSLPELEYATGRVPWYLNRWTAKNDAKEYFEAVGKEIQLSLEKLKDEKKARWNSFVLSSIQYLLKIEVAPIHFDRKYLLVKRNKGVKTFVGLFPLVEEAYRKFFWDDLKKHIDEYEPKLLQICAHEKTTDDVRDRLFEQMVISRISQSGLSAYDVTKILNAANVTITSDMRAALERPFILDLVHGMTYPSLAASDGFTLYIPLAPNFPAVDLFFCLREVVIAFQIHVGKKQMDVLTSVQWHTKNAEWKKGGIHTIILVYLLPVARLEKNSKTTRSLKTKRQQPLDTSTEVHRDGCKYVTMHKSLHDFDPLQSMNWRPV